MYNFSLSQSDIYVFNSFAAHPLRLKVFSVLFMHILWEINVFPKFSFQVSYPVEDGLVITLGGFFVKTAAAVKFVKDELELTECCLFTEFFWFTWLTLSWEVEA